MGIGFSIMKDIAGVLAPGVGVGRRSGSRGGAGRAYENTDVKRRKGGKTGVRRCVTTHGRRRK